MAEDIKQIVSFEIIGSDAVIKLTGEMAELKKQALALRTEFDKGIKSATEYATAINALNEAMAGVDAKIKATTLTTTRVTESTKAATVETANLTKAQTATTEASNKQSAATDALDSKIKALGTDSVTTAKEVTSIGDGLDHSGQVGFAAIEKLRTQTIKLKAEQKALDKQLADGKIEADAYKLATIANSTAQHKLSEELKGVGLETKKTVQVNSSAEGSIDQLRAKLSLLTKQYNAMSEAERQSGKGLQLQLDTKGISDQLKLLEGKVGDTRRNVGNYAEGIRNALGIGLKGSVDVAAQSVQGLGGAFGGARGAISSFSTGLAGGPIVAALTLLPTLISGVTQAFGELDDAFLPLEAKFNGFKAYTKNLFFELSKGTEVQSRGFWDSFFAPVTARLETFQNEVMTGIGNSSSAIAGVLAKNFTTELDSLQDAYGIVKFNIQKTLAEIEELQLKSRDRTLLKDERLSALNKARDLDIKATKDQLQAETDIASNQIKTLLNNNYSNFSKYIRKSGALTIQELEEITKEANKLANEGNLGVKQDVLQPLLTENLTKAIALQNVERKKTLEYNAESSRIRNGQLAEEKAARDKAETERKAAAAKELADLRAVAALKIQIAATAEEEYQAKKESLELENRVTTEAAPQNKALLQAKLDKDLLALNKEFQDKLNNQEYQAEQERIANEKAAYDEDLKRTEEFYTQKNLEIKQGLADGTISTEQGQAQILSLEEKHLLELRELALFHEKETVSIDNRILDAKIANNAKELAADKAKADKQHQIQQAQLGAARSLFNGITSLTSAAMNNSAKAADFQKAIALATSFADSGVAIANVIRIASTSSPDPITFGVELATMIGTVLGSIANAISIINSASTPSPTPLKKMALGGYIDGPSHAAGGVVRELEGGEYVVSGKGVKAFGPVIHAMNTAANQGISSVATGIQNKVAFSDSQMAQFAHEVGKLQVVTSIYDIARVTGNKARIEQAARV
jgi:hypothetical protein